MPLAALDIDDSTKGCNECIPSPLLYRGTNQTLGKCGIVSRILKLNPSNFHVYLEVSEGGSGKGERRRQ